MMLKRKKKMMETIIQLVYEVETEEFLITELKQRKEKQEEQQQEQGAKEVEEKKSQEEKKEKHYFVKTAKAFLSTLFEELVLRLTSSSPAGRTLDDGRENDEMTGIYEMLFVFLTKQILSTGLKILTAISSSNSNKSEWNFDHVLREKSFLCSILHSVLYTLSLDSVPLSLLELLINDLQVFMLQVTELCNSSTICAETFSLLSLSIPRKKQGISSTGGDGGMEGGEFEGSNSNGGWKIIKAIFEDSETSFSISDNGTTYTSLHSSNTCALVNYRFTSTMKGAWEFLLEGDSLSDECSVFGAARQPLRSRCYSSSNGQCSHLVFLCLF
jgi:hypothetical protein